MPLYLGSKKFIGLWLGSPSVSRVWLGTDLVYQKGTPPGPAESTLFDNGWIYGISWSGNLLTRPQYTTLGTYDFSQVTANGFMSLTITSQSGYANVNHNCHVCTTNLITVPSGATKAKVTLRRNSFVNPYVIWGLLPDNAPDSMSTSAGGQLSSATTLGNVDWTTLTLTLSAGIAGSQLRAIVNLRGKGNDSEYQTIDIKKFWFE